MTDMNSFPTIVLRIPFFATTALVPGLRPHNKWSVKQAFMTRLGYRILDLTSRVGITERLTLQPRKEGKRFHLVKPVTIGGTWYPEAPGVGNTPKTVFLYFHGGAFIAGDGRDATCAPIAKKLLDKGGADVVFSVQYRLSGYGGVNPFPAALQDALSSYLYLLHESEIPASHIVVAGDSSGGNLTMALLLYLHNFGTTTQIPTPRAAVLISPWVAPFHYDMRDNPHRGTDFIPATYSFWVQGQWADEMRSIQGNEVEVYHEQDAVHDTFLSAEPLGFETSAWEVAQKIAEFVSKH
ncbi:alpha/beta hydrolase fold-3 domain-containing protein [Xylaria venustula]|nr:alpha/beta hydrolase fold-3 domain-containing protein [Xylaria venustula]